MTAEREEAKEVEKALEFMSELRKDPQKLRAWEDRVIDGWLKKKQSFQRRSRTSRRA